MLALWAEPTAQGLMGGWAGVQCLGQLPCGGLSPGESVLPGAFMVWWVREESTWEKPNR